VRPGQSLRLAAGARRQRVSLMKTMGLLLVLVCATSLSGSAQEAGDSNAATAVRALEGERVKAQSRNDNFALDLIFDNALVYIEYGKVMTKGDYLSRVKSAKPHLQQIVLEAMTVRSVENTAIVVGTYRKTDVKDGKPSLKRWRFVDTWVNKKGSWMLVAAAAVPLSK
jgi:outer membrane lipoprotein-sorting protein